MGKGMTALLDRQLTFLDRRSVRLGLLAALLIGVGVIAVTQFTGQGGAARPATPAQVQQLSGWIARVQMPAALQVDGSQTACLGGVLLCVIGPQTPSELISTVRAALQANGASLGSSTCATTNPKAVGWAVCSVSGSYRNVAISLAAGERRSYAQPSSWVSVDASGVPYVQPKRLPLASPSALASVGAFPAGLRLSLSCRLYTTGGCIRYQAQVALPGSACAETAQLRNELVASDFRIVGYAAAQAGRTCGIDAARALRPGGQEMILVGWRLTDGPGGRSKGFLSIGSY